VNWLEKAKCTNIIIVDNNSTAPELLDYLEKSPHRVVRLPENIGHLAVWKSGLFDKELSRDFYAVSDCDVVPDEQCPLDLLDVCFSHLKKQALLTKVGPSLRIDNLPDHFAEKKAVEDWEGRFWKKLYSKDQLYIAPIDTTFAVYRPGIFPDRDEWWISARTAPPYMVRHLPWYENSAEPDVEAVFYAKSIRQHNAHWTTDTDNLLENFRKLQQRVAELELENCLVSSKWQVMVYRLLRKAWVHWKFRKVRL
jgi:hypothetical protein